MFGRSLANDKLTLTRFDSPEASVIETDEVAVAYGSVGDVIIGGDDLGPTAEGGFEAGVVVGAGFFGVGVGAGADQEALVDE